MMIEQRMAVQRLTVGSVYKLIGIGAYFGLIPFACLMGLFALFGAHTVAWNDQQLTGVTGLMASPFIGAFLATLCTVLFGTIAACGLWLFSKWKPLVLKVQVYAESKGGT